MKLKWPAVDLKPWVDRFTRATTALQRSLLAARPRLVLPRLNLPAMPVRLPFRSPAWLSIRPPGLNLARWRAWLGLAGVLLGLVAVVALAFWQRNRISAMAAALPDDVTHFRLSGEDVLVWYTLGDAAGEELTGLIDEFNADNPWGVLVVPQPQPSYTLLRQRLDDALSHGATPDLVALDSHHIAAYALEGHVVALDAYLNDPELGWSQAQQADFIPGLLDGERNPQLDSQLFSFPMGPDVSVLVYNVDWLRSLGFQDPPLTWGAFKEICRQAAADLNGDGRADIMGYAFVPEPATFSAFVLTRGGELLAADGQHVLFNSQEGERAMRILRDTYRSGCAYTLPGQDWARADFASARVLFTIIPSSALPAYRSAIERDSSFRWGVAALPYNTTAPATPLYGQSWAVLKTTPSRQLAAWLFIRWFSGPSQAQRWARANYTAPLRLSAVRALQEDDELDPAFKPILELATQGRREPVVAAWETVGEIMLETMQAIIQDKEPTEALEWAEKAANAALLNSHR